MRNHREATARRLSDPDFQATLVHTCLLLCLGLTVVVIALVGHDAWVWTHPPAARYFAIDGKHAPRPIVALDSPIMDDAELLEWTVKAVLAPYNVNYHDYPVQLNTASRRFTSRGWNTFAESFIGNGNFEEIKRARLLCHAQTQRAALINQTSFAQGSLTYRVEVPITQTCENSNQVTSSPLMISALVVRTDNDDHPDGLAIEQLVAKPNL